MPGEPIEEIYPPCKRGPGGVEAGSTSSGVARGTGASESPRAWLASDGRSTNFGDVELPLPVPHEPPAALASWLLLFFLLALRASKRVKAKVLAARSFGRQSPIESTVRRRCSLPFSVSSEISVVQNVFRIRIFARDRSFDQIEDLVR